MECGLCEEEAEPLHQPWVQLQNFAPLIPEQNLVSDTRSLFVDALIRRRQNKATRHPQFSPRLSYNLQTYFFFLEGESKDKVICTAALLRLSRA